MIEMLTLALLAGVALGIFFFAGLWWTVRKGLIAKSPAALFLLSFLLRMGIALSVFYWIAQIGEWQHIAIALVGFIIARMVLMRIAPSPQEHDQIEDENREKPHAP